MKRSRAAGGWSRFVEGTLRLKPGLMPTAGEVRAAWLECHANRIGEARDAVRFWCRFGLPIDERHFPWLEHVEFTGRFIRSCTPRTGDLEPWE